MEENDETTGEYVERLANELEAKILEVGPDNIAGFFGETIVGATTGCPQLQKAILKQFRKSVRSMMFF